MFFIFVYEILIKRFKLFQDHSKDYLLNNNLEDNKKYKPKLETIYENNNNLTDYEKKIKKYFDDKYIIEIV